jgi:hypothetical protein
MSKEVRLCKNCKYFFHKNADYNIKLYYCAHPELVSLDLVTGRPIYPEASFMRESTPDDARHQKKCGQVGVYWESFL